jgi:hypothetical protein
VRHYAGAGQHATDIGACAWRESQGLQIGNYFFGIVSINARVCLDARTLGTGCCMRTEQKYQLFNIRERGLHAHGGIAM